METKPSPSIAAATDVAAILASIRVSIIGDRKPLKQIAEALGCSERAIYMLIDRYKIPYLKVLNVRHALPADIHAALLREQANSPPRGRGRPRKIA